MNGNELFTESALFRQERIVVESVNGGTFDRSWSVHAQQPIQQTFLVFKFMSFHPFVLPRLVTLIKYWNFIQI